MLPLYSHLPVSPRTSHNGCNIMLTHWYNHHASSCRSTSYLQTSF